MYVVYFILSLATAGLLILIASVSPARPGVSVFELSRRKGQGNKDAEYELVRETLIADLYSLRRLAVAVLLVLFVLLMVVSWGFLWGALVSVALALSYGKLASLALVHNLAMRLYEDNEKLLFKFIEGHAGLMRLVRSVVWVDQRQTIGSREELEHLVKDSQGILREDDKRRIVNSLHFDERKVEDIMTPRGVVCYANKDDIVGPLILDDLHKTGHSRFPVIDGDIDHVVGLLYTRDLMTLGNKSTKTAAEIMDDHVYYINTDQTLNHALTAFLKSHRHMFVVVNEYRETAGVVTLEDVIEALLGYKIVDEFDQHDDLRAVAERVAQKNNNPPHATNV